MTPSRASLLPLSIALIVSSLAQHIDCGFEVAVRFGQGAFAFHQARVGLFAEGLDELRVDHSFQCS